MTTDMERLAVVTSAYTGVLCAASFASVHEYIEEVLGRPVQTIELAFEGVLTEIREKSKPEFLALWGLTQ